MCREVIVPAFDITPEMLTHTFVVDPKSLQPLPSGIWEQYDWAALPEDQEELVTEYIARACRILDAVGLTPQGVTSPGGFGGRTLPFYARCAGEAVRQVTGNPVPYFFQRVSSEETVDTPVWYPDRQTGQATGEIIASTGDWTGSWTGYGEVDADKYITPDLEGGRLPALIDAGEPAVLISHWQGFYGMHDGDRRGFRAFRKVVGRLAERDPRGERTEWRTCSQITTYACAREMAEVTVEGNTVRLDLPVRTPDLTLRLTDGEVRSVRVDDRPLARASNRAAFRSGTSCWRTGRSWPPSIPPGAGCRWKSISRSAAGARALVQDRPRPAPRPVPGRPPVGRVRRNSSRTEQAWACRRRRWPGYAAVSIRIRATSLAAGSTPRARSPPSGARTPATPPAPSRHGPVAAAGGPAMPPPPSGSAPPPAG